MLQPNSVGSVLYVLICGSYKVTTGWRWELTSVWPAGQQRHGPCAALAAGGSGGNLHVRPLRGTRTVRGAQEPDGWEPTACRCISVHAEPRLKVLLFVLAVALRDYAWTSRYSVLYIDNPVGLANPRTLSGDVSWISLREFVCLSSSRGGNRVQLHGGWQRLRSEPGWCWSRPVQVKHWLPPDVALLPCHAKHLFYTFLLCLCCFSLLKKCSDAVLPNLPRVSGQRLLCNRRGAFLVSSSSSSS